jgi:hypothetical protein
MKKRVFSLLSILLMITLFASPVSAGRGIGLSGVTFSLGSLIANGTLVRLGPTDVTVALDAEGIPAIICTNNGQNDVPGRSAPKVFASGTQFVDGDSVTKNGKAPFSTETTDPETLPWDVAGCPNSNWTARIDNILWTGATITVKDSSNNVLLGPVQYVCFPKLQTETSVTCKPK